MESPHENPAPANQPPERLSWTHYSYTAVSLGADGNYCTGFMRFNQRPTRHEVTKCALERAAMEAELEHVPWDPFNVSVFVERMRTLEDILNEL